MVWGGNGKIYFFKGSKFWRFDPAKRPPVKSSYPKPISNWEGVPNNLDAALKYTNGYTYFFKGDKYYRFHDARFAVSTIMSNVFICQYYIIISPQVDSATPPFPRPTAHWWFGCKNTPSSTGNIVEGSDNEFEQHSMIPHADDGNGDDFDAGEWDRLSGSFV